MNHRRAEIQTKKEALISLETALKKRINEFKELCLKEGELTGHLPIDYPFQPREPIPQIRRRIKHHSHSTNSNSSNTSNSTSTSSTTASTNNINSTIITSNNNNSSSNNNNSSTNHAAHHNVGLANFQPYYEETKPFQMSDFYKYSSKHRQKIQNDAHNTNHNNHNNHILNNHSHHLLHNQHQSPPKFKTTRQLQEDVMKKNSLKFSNYDDQIQASVRLIERSGQKLIEATTKAIAGNPSLAEKLNNILPNNGDRY